MLSVPAVKSPVISIPGPSRSITAMQLPRIAPGKRFTLPLPPGSADALLLARLARPQGRRRCTGVVTADPADAQRLAEELLFFAPDLRVAVFPDWETLPYDTFSPHQDLVSERLATLWRLLQHDLDVVLLPATTALTRLAPTSFLAATTFNFKQRHAARRGGAEGAAHAGRLQPREPGRVARRVRGARRPDRSVPDGFAGALPRGPVRRPGRLDPHLRPRHAAQPLPGARGAPAARPRVPDRRGRARRLSRALARAARRRPDTLAHLQGHRAGHRRRRHRVLPAAVLRQHGDDLRLPRRAGRAGAAWRPRRGDRRASGPTRASATASCSTTRSGRSCRRRPSSCAPTSSSRSPRRTPRWRCVRPRTPARPRPRIRGPLPRPT